MLSQNELQDILEINNAFKSVLSYEKKFAESIVKFEKLVSKKGYNCVEKAIEESMGIDSSVVTGILDLSKRYGSKIPNLIDELITRGLVNDTNPNNVLQYLCDALEANSGIINDSTKINQSLIYKIMAIFYKIFETGDIDPALYEPLASSPCLVCGAEEKGHNVRTIDVNRFLEHRMYAGFDVLEYGVIPVVLCDECDGKYTGANNKITKRSPITIRLIFDYLSRIINRYGVYYLLFKKNYENLSKQKELMEAEDNNSFLLE